MCLRVSVVCASVCLCVSSVRANAYCILRCKIDTFLNLCMCVSVVRANVRANARANARADANAYPYLCAKHP